jgi:hypothetical protein
MNQTQVRFGKFVAQKNVRRNPFQRKSTKEHSYLYNNSIMESETNRNEQKL